MSENMTYVEWSSEREGERKGIFHLIVHFSPPEDFKSNFRGFWIRVILRKPELASSLPLACLEISTYTGIYSSLDMIEAEAETLTHVLIEARNIIKKHEEACFLQRSEIQELTRIDEEIIQARAEIDQSEKGGDYSRLYVLKLLLKKKAKGSGFKPHNSHTLYCHSCKKITDHKKCRCQVIGFGCVGYEKGMKCTVCGNKKQGVEYLRLFLDEKSMPRLLKMATMHR